MKTQLTQFILGTFLIALLIGGNVNAKGTEIVVVSGLEYIYETEMEVEDWMVSENYWNKQTENYYLADYSESELQIENWMLDNQKWLNSNFEMPVAEKDQELRVEDWMTNKRYWN